MNGPREESASRFHEAVDIVLEAWTSEKLSYQGKYHSYEGVEVLPKPMQTPHPPVWMAATSTTAIDWAAAKGFSILMDPHSSRTDLASKRRHYREKLEAAGHSDAGRVIPMARLIAVDETAEKAREVARRAAQWTVGSYVGATHHRQEVRTFGGKDPIAFYLDDVMLHGTAESVADQIRALEADGGMTYLMAAPLSRRSFALLTDKVLPRIAS
jgi:alkanesulfonate monooxygenase SsuD/methylene tetrahydromethanopterin reductase-like flavin-dependent oxidoreductase (luciferase family)